MKKSLCQILIVSHHSLFIEALVRLLRSVGAPVQGQAANVEAALRLLETQSIDTVIVDRTSVSQSEAELISVLTDNVDEFTVIFLTTGNDQMTVYRREQITYTGPDILAQLLYTANR